MQVQRKNQPIEYQQPIDDLSNSAQLNDETGDVTPSSIATSSTQDVVSVTQERIWSNQSTDAGTADMSNQTGASSTVEIRSEIDQLVLSSTACTEATTSTSAEGPVGTRSRKKSMLISNWKWNCQRTEYGHYGADVDGGLHPPDVTFTSS